jgi:hypothetical protein
MELQVLKMDELEPFLIEALQETSSIVSRVEERYRDSAFPIILQSILKDQYPTNIPSMPNHIQGANGQRTQVLRLPPGISANEFLRKAAPNSHPARFACIAYYLLHTGKADQFNVPVILDVYTKLRQPKPGNPSDVINKYALC